MVSELIALVGGSDSGTDDRPAEKRKGIGAKIRNTITSSKEADAHRQMAHLREKETQAAKLIPLAEDEFDDF